MPSHIWLVLDTNVLRDKDFIQWIRRTKYPNLAVSVVAYMEYKRQNNVKRSEQDVRSWLKELGISIISFKPDDADEAAMLMSERKEPCCRTCNKIDWADTMIFSSIGNPPTLLVTHNTGDFPSFRVITPREAMRRFGS